jgi:hypothetical protein
MKKLAVVVLMLLFVASSTASAIIMPAEPVPPIDKEIKDLVVKEMANARCLEQQIQIAKEIDAISIPQGWVLINATIVDDYYIAYYNYSGCVEISCREDPHCIAAARCAYDETHIVVHHLGTNETNYFYPQVWAVARPC